MKKTVANIAIIGHDGSRELRPVEVAIVESSPPSHIKYMIHRGYNGSKTYWCLSEYTSGMLLVTATTQKAAMESLNQSLQKNGNEWMENRVIDMLEEHGIANMPQTSKQHQPLPPPPEK